MLLYFSVLMIVFASFLSDAWGTSLEKDLFSSLNPDLQGCVISFLKEPRDFLTMKQVSKSWKEAMEREDLKKIWTNFPIDLSKSRITIKDCSLPNTPLKKLIEKECSIRAQSSLKELNDKDYTILASSPFLLLNLRNANISLAQLKILLRSPGFTFLNLHSNAIGNEGAKVLSEAPFSNLKKLILCDNNIGKEGVIYLSHGNFPRLEHLDLWYNDIGDEGAASLASGQFPALKELSLWKNNITYEGAKTLIQNPLPQLEFLSLHGNNITHPESGVSLQNKRPTLVKLDDIGLASTRENLKVEF